MKRIILFLLIISPEYYRAQERESAHTPRFSPLLSGSLLTGGRFAPNTIDFKTGAGVYLGTETNRKGVINWQFGAGLEFYQEETFSPLFAGIRISPGKHKTSAMVVQAGHSFADHSLYRLMDDYTFRGGRLVAIGWQKEFPVKENTSLILSLRYRTQSASLTYSGESGITHRQHLVYSMIQATFGIKL